MVIEPGLRVIYKSLDRVGTVDRLETDPNGSMIVWIAYDRPMLHKPHEQWTYESNFHQFYRVLDKHLPNHREPKLWL